MQIWLKSSVFCVILSHPKRLHCKVMQDKGVYSSSAVTESSGYTYGASLTPESFTCALL